MMSIYTALAAISLSTTTTYVQNFDSLGTSATATLPPDFKADKQGTVRTVGTYAAAGTVTERVGGSGLSTTAGNGIYNFGSGTGTAGADRAAGFLSSGTATQSGNLYAEFVNNTGGSLTGLKISYDVEKYRNGSNAAGFSIQLYHSTDGATWTNAGANFLTSFAADANNNGFTPAPGATSPVTDQTLSVTIPNSSNIYLAWNYSVTSGTTTTNAQALAIDNVNVLGLTGPPPPATPNLTVTDVMQAEGNAGTTVFTFTVNLSSPAGASGVTFDIATQDGTALDGDPAGDDTDYGAKSEMGRTIASGDSSATFTVDVNGDTTTEPNETFFVNVTHVTGANTTDGQGQGTIQNDDVTLTPIYTIQGSGSTSPLDGQSVSTSGIVTGIKAGSSGGFFIQDSTGDGNTSTSDGIFVFTGASVPAGAVIGNNVQVTGTVVEFTFSSDPNSPPITEISSVTSTVVLSSGNPLPTPQPITAADTTASSGTTNPLDALEEFEGMRVSVTSLAVVAPTQGSINEPNATVFSTGVFYGVVTGVARPFREPGIAISDPLPPGSPANVPRFDENPERIRVDSDGQPGATTLDVAAGTIVSNIVGPLDYSFRTYTILPDAAPPPTVGTLATVTPVPAATSAEFTVASFNLERFFDTVNDPDTGDPVLTTTAFNNRLNKASLIIRNVQRSPDVIGVQELENLTTLQAVADKVNNDTVTGGGANPNYQAFLVEGNDVGGIDVGFLVKTSRVTVMDVTQEGKATTYTEPGGGSALLNDRPPLILRATIARPGSLGTLAFTAIVNHLRSLSGVDDPADGARVREKRRKQAEFLANLIQTRQTADPTEKIISVGDYNAFQFNDGYVDVIGTIKGTPAPPDQVVLASSDLVNPDLIDLVDTLPPDQRYSFTFDGSAQVLDHVLVNDDANAILTRFAYARDDADFPVKFYEDGTRPERISDHDQPVAYFTLGVPAQPGQVLISEFRFNGPNGAEDEFIELYNNTENEINVQGWTLSAPSGTGGGGGVIGGAGIISPRGHYLVAPSGYSLSDYPAGNGTTATPDFAYTGGVFLQDGGAKLIDTLGNVVDAVGFSSANGTDFREGTGLTPATGVSGIEQFSFVRRLFPTGVPQDTNENATDFLLVSVEGVVGGATPGVLGAPGPENSTSPLQRNGTIKASLIDNCTGMGTLTTGCQNRVRDPAPAPIGTSGTLRIRRKFTNTSGQPVTQLRFRVVDITTFNSPGYAPNNGQADLRVVTTPGTDSNGDISVTLSSGGQPILVRGTQVETPPAQPNGGGLNSSIITVTPVTPISPASPNHTVTVEFTLGVQQNGNFRFFVNVEALFDNTVRVLTKTTMGKMAGKK